MRLFKYGCYGNMRPPDYDLSYANISMQINLKCHQKVTKLGKVTILKVH